MAEHGFACPLLAQFSDELRSTAFGRVVAGFVGVIMGVTFGVLRFRQASARKVK
jgi:hypothetical protein